MRPRATRPMHAMLLLATLVATAAPAALAQDAPPDTLLLRWSDIPSRAPSHPETALGRIEIDRARGERMSASVFPSFPELESAYDTDAPFGAEGESSWELGLWQEIELGGRHSLRVSAADASVARAELEVRSRELDARAELGRAYARLAAAEAQARLLDTLVGFTRRLDTIALRLLAAEEISELDRNAVAVERGRGEIERLQAATDVAEARIELARLLDLPAGTVVTVPVDETIGDPAAAVAEAAGVERALATGNDSALVRRPDWLALEREADRARAERTLASRLWLPSLRLGAAVAGETSILDGRDLTGSSDLVRDGFGRLQSDHRTLGLRLNVGIPLPFSGLYDLGSGAAAVADAELAAIDVRRRLLAGRIRAEVRSAAVRLRNAATAYDIFAREIAPLVSRNLDLLERGYREGELSATEIVAQQQQFMRAGEAAIAARRAYGEALADFDRAVAR